jgi:glycine hydroxymethyltransferase
MSAMVPETIRDASTASQAFKSALEVVGGVAPEVAAAIRSELEDQRHALKLIASENYSSPAVQLAMGQWMTDKYAEGATGKRWYAGCENVDTVEGTAASLAQELFGADHAYVQPHSGADANLVAFSAILAERVEKPYLEEQGVRDSRLLSEEQWEELRQRLVNQRMLAMELTSGGHLTHGMRANLSAKLFEIVPYGVDPESGLIDYDRVRELALETRPLLILAGHSSYPRKIDFRRFREIADEVGAVFMVDMAHFAGLVAGGIFEGEFDPVPYAHIVTSTTHKTLRGPRGGLVLCTSEFADAVDRGCPMILGGPLPHVMAAKAVAFHEALAPEFRDYAAAIVANARALAEALVAGNEVLQTGGTENHLLLVDVRQHGLNGRQAEAALRECNIVLNRNVLPYDPNGPWFTSGIRLGTAALTTRGFGEGEMGRIAELISTVLGAAGPIEDVRGKPELPQALVDEVRATVEELTAAYPLYPGLVV